MAQTVTLPISVIWNEATQQWRVLFYIDQTHLQEFKEDDKYSDFFECKTVKALVTKMGFSKDNKNNLIMVLREIKKPGGAIFIGETTTEKQHE
jgi:hypothetical protein